MSAAYDMTPDDQALHLARMLKSFPSFCALFELDDFNHPGKRIPMRLTPIQREYNRIRSPRDIILKPRKVYITTLEFVRDLWWFLTREGTDTVICCQSEDKHRALRRVSRDFRKLLESLRTRIPGIGSKERDGLRFDTETDTELVWLEKRSSLTIVEAGAAEKTASKAGRGGVIHRLHVTEAAFFEHGIETLTALQGAMPPELSAGELVIESTPNGASGFYYDQWQKAVKGDGDFKPCFFRWYQHADYQRALDPGEVIAPANEDEERMMAMGVSPEAIKWRRKKVADSSEDKVAQEYPSDPHSCFLTGGRCFFDLKLVVAQQEQAPAAAANEDHEQLRIWEDPKPGSEYVVGADTSEGTGGNACAALVFERGTGRHVATLHGQFIPWVFGHKLAALGERYNTATIAVERNNHGHAVLQALEHLEYINEHGEKATRAYPHIYKHSDDKLGYPTNEATRSPMLDALDASHRKGIFQTPDAQMLQQMRDFAIGKTGKAEGKEDDLVLGGAIGWAVVTGPLGGQRHDYDPYGENA